MYFVVQKDFFFCFANGDNRSIIYNQTIMNNTITKAGLEA